MCLALVFDNIKVVWLTAKNSYYAGLEKKDGMDGRAGREIKDYVDRW